MNEIVLSCYFINDWTYQTVDRLYNNSQLMTSASRPLFAVGNVLVLKTVIVSDPFDATFGVRHEFAWVCTPAELNEKFNIVDDVHRTENFALITPK